MKHFFGILGVLSALFATLFLFDRSVRLARQLRRNYITIEKSDRYTHV